MTFKQIRYNKSYRSFLDNVESEMFNKLNHLLASEIASIMMYGSEYDLFYNHIRFILKDTLINP